MTRKFLRWVVMASNAGAAVGILDCFGMIGMLVHIVKKSFLVNFRPMMPLTLNIAGP